METALHEKYSLIPPEYVEDGVETARRMSIERRWTLVYHYCHVAFLADPCPIIALPCQFILMLMLWKLDMTLADGDAFQELLLFLVVLKFTHKSLTTSFAVPVPFIQGPFNN